MTAGCYTVLFLHPAWSRYSISSIGAQALWIFFTWFIWVAGAATLNSAIPRLLVGGSCFGLVYCSQIQGLFGESDLASPPPRPLSFLTWCIEFQRFRFLKCQYLPGDLGLVNCD